MTGAAGYDLRRLIGGMSAPWQVVNGAADELSPPHWVAELARLCPVPVSVTSYAGARHSMTESPAAALGPSWRGLTVDWLHDRVKGIPVASESRFVTRRVMSSTPDNLETRRVYSGHRQQAG